jgi:hypothetical protein
MANQPDIEADFDRQPFCDAYGAPARDFGA